MVSLCPTAPAYLCTQAACPGSTCTVHAQLPTPLEIWCTTSQDFFSPFSSLPLHTRVGYFPLYDLTPLQPSLDALGMSCQHKVVLC